MAGRPPIGKTAMTGAERQRRYWLKQRVANKPVPKTGADNATIAALQKELATAVRYRDLAQEFAQTMQQLATARARSAELEKAWSDLSSELPNILALQEEHPDARTPEECWQWSLGLVAGDTIAMHAYWDREFPGWQKFRPPAEVITLARQAASAWQAVVHDLEGRTGNGNTT